LIGRDGIGTDGLVQRGAGEADSREVLTGNNSTGGKLGIVILEFLSQGKMCESGRILATGKLYRELIADGVGTQPISAGLPVKVRQKEASLPVHQAFEIGKSAKAHIAKPRGLTLLTDVLNRKIMFYGSCR
jgi:hypothetical protein